MSRTNHPRIPGTHRAGRIARYCQSYCCEPARRGRSAVEGAAITEGLYDLDEPEHVEPLDCDDFIPSWVEIERRHVEALSLNALPKWEREFFLDPEGYEEDLNWEVMVERDRMDLEARREEEARYDDAYGGYSDDQDHGDYDGCWLPYMRIEELRETFGHNWLGNGFHIDSTNAVRRVTRKAPTMKDYERVQEVMAAQAKREQAHRLATQLHPEGKAKVARPLPVPHAERPEAAPYDKFAGRYNEALDPISPNFDRSAW